MKKLIIASICVALGVVLSTTSIPVGPARIFPFQHMINVILAVVVGARFSVGAAFSTSCLRNVLALGSPLAFPGSMIGAWLSAYLYKKYNALWAAALGEIIGTGLIGALVSYPIANFLLGKPGIVDFDYILRHELCSRCLYWFHSITNLISSSSIT